VSGLALYTAAMEVCGPELGTHAARVGALAEMIARRLGWEDDRVDDVRLGVALHDVGKIALRHELLRKPGALDQDELVQIRAHPVEGAWLIAGVRSMAGALPFILFHHERWDGTGYPTRRAGNEIPLEGRLLSIADAFDAMNSPRHYRTPLTLQVALAEIERCAGSQFDPEIAEAFFDAWHAGELAATPTVLAATA